MKFSYTHYLQAGIMATEWAEENLPGGKLEEGPVIPVPIPLSDGTMWEYGAVISRIELRDPDGLGVQGELVWHPDGFWAFNPAIEVEGE